MTQQQPPPGQPPIDPRGAFAPVPPPGARGGWVPPPMPGPMGPPPPMMWGPPPPPHRERSFARAIFMTLATTIFGASLMLNVYLLLFAGFAHSSGSKTSIITQGDPKQKVAVVSVTGMMLNESAERFGRLLKEVAKDGDVKALVVEINTPGGSVTSADQMHHLLSEFKTAKGMPVYVAMTELGTSGGYYLACAADKIYAQPTTMTGNIGVLMPRYDLSGFADKYGIHDTSIHSTGADYKTAGSMLRPETPEEHAYILGLIDQAFVQFKSVVQTGRTTKLTKPINEIANGKVYSAGEAKALGLVDDILYRDEVFDKAAKDAGLSNHTTVRFEDPPNIFDLFSAESKLGAPGTKGNVTVNGVNLNVGVSALQEFMTPRMMYLWRGQ